MIHEVVLPQLGVVMEQGKLIEWFKKEGDTVAAGENLFSVETEKTTMDIESTVSGRIVRIIHLAGDNVNSGQVVALVSTDGEVTSSELERLLVEIKSRETVTVGSGEIASEEKMEPLPKQQLESAKNKETLVRASPSARRLMRQHSIEPSLVLGTGAGGTISAEDVNRFIQKSSNFRISSVEKLSGRRLTISERLGKNEAVSVTLFTEVDFTLLDEERSRIFVEGKKPSLTAILIPVLSRALRAYPKMNAVFEDNTVKIIENVNIGIAVDTPEGLIVPVLKDADKQDITGIVQGLSSLGRKAHDSKLTPDDVSLGTFTVTNLGSLDVQGFTPVINPPQIAILGVGRMMDKPVAFEGKIAIRKMVTFRLDLRPPYHRWSRCSEIP